MASKPETVFRKRVVDKLKTLHGAAIFSIQQVTIHGTPDLFICANGLFVAWELKSSVKKKPTKIQQHNMDRINATSGHAVCVHPDNFDAEMEWLKWYLYQGEPIKDSAGGQV